MQILITLFGVPKHLSKINHSSVKEEKKLLPLPAQALGSPNIWKRGSKLGKEVF